MIEGFDLQTAPLTEEEKKLVPIIIEGLHNRQGRTKAIFGSVICKKVSEKYGTLTEPRLRKITNFLRSAKILPVIATSRGYYVSYEKEEIQKQIDSLKGRRDAIDESIKGLELWLK